MKIGEIISELRRKSGITQDQLAEAVGVSAQAVSKWENNASLPDITLLEPLASYFRVSIDVLVGFTPPEVEGEITKIWEEMNSLLREGKYVETIDILKRSLKKYPSIDKLKIWLGDTYTDYGNSLKKNNENTANLFYTLAVETLEGVLKGCSDHDMRAWIYTGLFDAYMALNQYSSASGVIKEINNFDRKAGKMLEAKYNSKIGDKQRSLKLLQESLYESMIDIMNYCSELDNVYNLNGMREKAAKYRKVLSDAVNAFIEQDTKFMSGPLFNNYMMMAIRYSKVNKSKEAIEALIKAADYAVKSMTPDEIPAVFDMIDAQEVTISRTEADETGNNVKTLIAIMERGKAYPEIQGLPEFTDILNRLRETIKQTCQS